MANTLANRAQMTVNGAPGTGNITLLAASPGRQTFNAAIGSAGTFTIPYEIEDTASAWEIGIGSYTTSTLTLVRTTVIASSAGGTTKITATAAAIVYISPLASDLQAGTTAGNLLQLDGSAKIPSVDGSQVTNLNGTAIATGTVPIARLPTGTTANTLPVLDSLARLPAVNGSLVTNLTSANLTGAIPAALLPNPSATTLGGVQSYAAVANQFLTSISTAGVPVSAQPTIAGIGGLGNFVALGLSYNLNGPGGVVATDLSSRLPAVDGSQLTNLPTTSGPIFAGNVTSTSTFDSSATLLYPTAVIDTTTAFSSPGYNPKKAGKYLTWVTTYWTGVQPVAGGLRCMPSQARGMIYLNGVQYYYGQTDIIQMNGTTDTLTWYCFQNSGTSLSMQGASVGAMWIGA